MKKQALSTIFKYAFLASTAASAILQTVAMLLSYDPNANYFLMNAPLPYVATAFAVLGAICGVLFSVYHTPAAEDASPFSGSLLPSLPAALGMLACAALMLLSDGGMLATITALLLFPAALYTLLCGTAAQVKQAPVLALLGFTAVIACALMNAHYYFDASLEMNAPIKVTIQTSLLFAMLSYTAELRYLLDRKKPRLFLALSMMTVGVSALPAVSIPIAFCCGIISRLDCLAGALLTLGIAITTLLRVCHLLSEQKKASQACTATEETTKAADIPDPETIPGKEEHEAE
ncbi:MAG: hypothetical protein IJX80_04250 [Clostridia bacterium]|nr:hypothetical protein [Clostridia bacterium]